MTEENEAPIICPICRSQRPSYSDIMAVRDEPEGSEIHKRVMAYNTCCNPQCNGTWGTGCWHCHHPRFLESCPDKFIFLIAFGARDNAKIFSAYWDRLLQIPNERIRDAWASCTHHDVDCSVVDWPALHLAITHFSITAMADANSQAESLKVKVTTILECKLAVCKFCRASAETGETTQHTCVAFPLTRMIDELLERQDLP